MYISDSVAHLRERITNSLLKRHSYYLYMIIIRIRDRQRLPSIIEIRIRNPRIHEAAINRCRLIDFFVLAPRTFWLRGCP